MAVDPIPLVETPEVGTQFNGAVGHVISAILQSAGIYAQSDILNNFGQLFQALGVLLVAASMAGAVASFAFFDGYRRALLILVCPILFLFVINFRVPGRPTIVRIGERYSTASEKVEKPLLEFLINPNGSQPQVSFVFTVFDNAVTAAVQQLVAFLVDTKNKEDLVNLARERVLINVLSAKAVTPELRKLVSYGIAGHCADLSRAIAEKQVAEKNEARIAELEKAGGDPLQAALRKRGFRNKSTQSADRIALLEKQSIELEPDVADYVTGLGFAPGESVTCDQVWEFTTKGFLTEASLALEQKAKEASTSTGDEEIPWQRVADQVKKVIESGAPGKVNEIIAAYLIRNTVLGTAHDKMTSQVFGRVHFRALQFNNIFNRLAYSDGEAGAFTLTYFAGSIPYIQGTLLFFLSMLFPFFAVLILIPARAKGFFIWMGLWVWVKSWDVGFAMIHVIREILWQYLSRGISIGREDINWNDPSAVYAVMNWNDPLAGFGTYYAIIEMTTIAVPFITAHLCLGADGFFDIFRGSIDKTAQAFRGRYYAGMRRNDATIHDIQMNRRIGEQGLKAMIEQAEKGLGVTANGVARHLSGDGAAARFLQGVYNDAAFQEKFAQVDFREISGQNTTRTMVYGSGWHTLPYATRANLYQEPFVTRFAYQGHNLAVPGLPPPSSKPGNFNTNIPVRQPKATSATDVDN